MDVVHDEHVIPAVFLFKLTDTALLHRGHEVLREFFRRYIKDLLPRERGLDVISNCLNEVRLSMPRGPVDKQRVVSDARGFDNSESGRVRQFVKRAHNKRFKRIALVKVALLIHIVILQGEFVRQ